MNEHTSGTENHNHTTNTEAAGVHSAAANEMSQAAAGAIVSAAPVTSNRTQNMLVGIMGTLVLMAGIQVFQTQQLMAAVESGAVKAGAPAQPSSSVGLPSQVGGCG